MNLKFLPFLIATLFLAQNSFSLNDKDLLQKEIAKTNLKELLDPGKQWVPYPQYLDRESWDKLTGVHKEKLIKKGEEKLSYEWKVIKATDYLAYERTGDRTGMQAAVGANNNALSNLVLAELAEGKGRFLDQIINGVFLYCEMTSWVLSAHLPAFQSSKRSLPDYREDVIDLMTGDVGSFMSWTYFFFNEEFDKVDPIISERLKDNIEKRILDPYMDRSDYWWQALNVKPGQVVNNWNPWCNFNVLTAFLLIEEDVEKLSKAVYRTMVSTDQFINYTKEDGACEEGPSYLGHAAGKLYDYLSILHYATNGAISVFDKPVVKNMGEYIARSYVGNDWVVNFADATAKGKGNPGLIFRYGRAVGSEMMMGFSVYLNEKAGQFKISGGRDIFRSLEDLKYSDEMADIKPSLPLAPYSWYPQTQFCYIRTNTDFFFAAKGGHNNESHNHNDIGTFSLYYKNKPFFIDAGVGTYTRKTFSKERYSIWTMQSDYHNVPGINGVSQSPGEAFKAREVKFDPKRRRLTLDISGAYPEEARVKKWQREYRMSDNGLTITDNFDLVDVKEANVVNFLTWSKPEIQKPGAITLFLEGEELVLTYDVKQFTPNIEAIPQSDPRLIKVWGEEIYRLSLISNNKVKSGQYKFEIERL